MSSTATQHTVRRQLICLVRPNDVAPVLRTGGSSDGGDRRHRAMSLALSSVLAAAFVAVALLLAPQPASSQASVVPSEVGPRYRADGKDADVYGRNVGYFACTGIAYVREDRCRVGALGQFDTLFPARIIAAPKTPSVLVRGAPAEQSLYVCRANLDTRPVS